MDSYTSQKVVFGTAFLDTIIAALKTVPGAALIASGKVRLSQDPAFNPQPGSTIAALATNEATFTGYTSGGLALVVGSPVNLSPTCQGAVTPLMFSATGSAISNVITGYWLDDGTNFIMGERFAAGETATFATAGDFLVLVLQIPAQALQPTA